MRIAGALTTFLAASLAPAVALACPVCGRGAPESEGAYIFMSGVLSALPLLMGGGIVYWVVRRARAAETEVAPERDDVPAEGNATRG